MTISFDELQHAICKERAWGTAQENSKDRGDYIDPSGPDYKTALRIKKAYRELVDALLERQRS